jgi:hypothetical protein
MKLLILAQDIDQAKQIANNLDIVNSYVVDELLLAEDTGLMQDTDSAGYAVRIVAKMRTIAATFKAKRPLIMIVNMKYQTAVAEIPHDMSCLIYDGSRSKRLQYSPTYKTTFKIRDSEDAENIQKLESAAKNIG